MHEDAKLSYQSDEDPLLICLGRSFAQDRFEKPNSFCNNLNPKCWYFVFWGFEHDLSSPNFNRCCKIPVSL